MRSKDDRKAKKTTPDVLTGRGGDELEPIIDPAESYIAEESPSAPDWVADVVDGLQGPIDLSIPGCLAHFAPCRYREIPRPSATGSEKSVTS